MASIFGKSTFSLVPDSGISRAKKLADIYVKQHTNARGTVDDPSVYQYVIDNFLSPFADDLSIQQKILTYQNNAKSIQSDNADAGIALNDLQLREHSAWYVDEDEEEQAGFRNPAYVATVTSESLDQLIAETIAVIQAKQAVNKDTVPLEKYLDGLVKRADRMRTLADGLNDGTKTDLDGYGYYVEADPNTGKVRGASLMPTDVDVEGIGKGMARTDTYVQVGDKRVPMYLPYVKDAQNQAYVTFGGREYRGTESLLQSADTSDMVLADRENIPYDGDTFYRGKVYRSFNGQNNIDGSPKQNYYYVGHDNKMYQFSDDDPNGRAFLESLAATSGMNIDAIPRVNPNTVLNFATTPLPKDDPTFAKAEQRGIQIDRMAQETEQKVSEAERLQSRSRFQMLADELPNTLSNLVPSFEKIGSFFEERTGFNPNRSIFDQKNRQSPPASAPERTAADTVDKGASFFRSAAQ